MSWFFCPVQMKVPVSMNEFMQLSVGGVTYDGPTTLIQYTVLSTSMVLKDPKYITVEITLKRMFKYHLAATFVPTILLMTVTEITLFVDEKHFEATIMVHLTTMLVMYTLYQGISASMPKTAYLKFMDIWLLYGLIVPFITFVVEVSLKLLSKNEESVESNQKETPLFQRIIRGDENNKSMSRNEIPKMLLLPDDIKTRREMVKNLLQHAAQTMIPLVTGIFIGGYFYLAVRYYND